MDKLPFHVKNVDIHDFILKKWSLLLKDVKNLTESAFHTSVVYKDKMFIFGGYNLVNFSFFVLILNSLVVETLQFGSLILNKKSLQNC